MIYVHTPDAWDVDVVPGEPAEARRVAMMLLAACAWADGHRPAPPDVPALDDRRRARRPRPPDDPGPAPGRPRPDGPGPRGGGRRAAVA